MAILARCDGGGAVIDYIDWKGPPFVPSATLRLATAPEIAALQPTPDVVALGQLQVQDATTFRMLEALIDVLLSKNVTAGQPLIVGTDFRADIRALYLARKALRVTAGVP